MVIYTVFLTLPGKAFIHSVGKMLARRLLWALEQKAYLDGSLVMFLSPKGNLANGNFVKNIVYFRVKSCQVNEIATSWAPFVSLLKNKVKYWAPTFHLKICEYWNDG